MKNNVTGFIVALFTMLAFINAKAQSTTTMFNSLNCPVVVTMSYYDANGYCGDDGPYSVSALSNLGYNAPGACGTIVSTLSTITAINGITLSSAVQISDGTLSPGASISIPGIITACGTGVSADFFSQALGSGDYRIQ